MVFQHYIEHKQEDKNISMLAFLHMHYLCGSPKDKDYERDMQLPFKAPSVCVASVMADFVPVTFQLSLLKPVEIDQKKLYGYFITSIPSSGIASIWQPPRSC